VDVDLLSVLPHAHLLGKHFSASARLPDGETLPLLTIPDWDFNWQGDYQYEQPVPLPRGTVLQLRYAYDNSTHNPRNPHNPPQRVRYGPNSTDEMAEFWLQLLPHNSADHGVLAETYNRTNFHRITAYNEQIVQERPTDFPARLKLGQSRLAQRRFEEARSHFEAAARLRPASGEPHYLLGLVARVQHRLAEAEREFRDAIRLDPTNAKSYGNLGLVLMDRGLAHEAKPFLQRALELNPQDIIARSALDRIELRNRR
jgi:tetratricopeptide (TPR) repeat protein